jgi:hypothetical protein
MPEPDLVTIGDRCVVDCASIICHLNTRGNFELAKIVTEKKYTLHTRSRIQQGVYMVEGSQLLEKSVAMTGEVIEAYSVWQGGPAHLLRDPGPVYLSCKTFLLALRLSMLSQASLRKQPVARSQ